MAAADARTEPSWVSIVNIGLGRVIAIAEDADSLTFLLSQCSPTTSEVKLLISGGIGTGHLAPQRR